MGKETPSRRYAMRPIVNVSEEDRAMDTGSMHKKIGKERACGSRDILTDRQTDRQTYSSQYFATAPAGEAIEHTTKTRLTINKSCFTDNLPDTYTTNTWIFSDGRLHADGLQKANAYDIRLVGVQGLFSAQIWLYQGQAYHIQQNYHELQKFIINTNLLVKITINFIGQKQQT